MAPARPLAYARRERPRFLAELVEFVRFPSVGGQPDKAAEMGRCARWLADRLARLGMPAVEVVPTAGHPIVLASWRGAPGKPVVLIYGHYDVQPADPLHEWTTPPFEPQVRLGSLYGRGASDDKGQLYAHVKALEAYLATQGTLPVNVVCLFEGEEEIGSRSLRPFLHSRQEDLSADVAVISDMPILGPGRPAITYSMRGSLSLELEVRGPGKDLHSGLFGGAVHNPLEALCALIAGLHDAGGRVALPGFYDGVQDWDPAEREFMRRNGPSDTQVLREAGARRGWGEPGFSLYERQTIRPALTVNGIRGGYAGPGGKGVIPARASAKISFRLVPSQDPRRIERLFRRYIAQRTPPTVESTVRTFFGSLPTQTSRRLPAMRAAAAAYRRGFGAEPAFIRSGGTIPIIHTLQHTLDMPVLLLGFALPGDRVHSPDERFRLENFYQGIDTAIWFLEYMGRTCHDHRRALPCRDRRRADRAVEHPR